MSLERLHIHTVYCPSPASGHVLNAIGEERRRQDAKWGQQDHPDGTGPLFEHHAFTMRIRTQRRAAEGTVTWTDIFLEEVYEALAETDPEKLRTELIQAAAVATSWAESIDRRPR